MATLQQSIVAIQFPAADPAAAPSGAFLAPQGASDIADIAAVLMPFAGTIVGISVTGNPASGDTVAVTPQVCTSIAGAGNLPAASLAVTITNAAPSASPIVTKDQTDAQFSAGAFVGPSRKSVPLSSVVNDCGSAWKGADSLTAHPGEQAIALLLTLPAVLWRMQGSVALSPRARLTAP